MFEQISQAWASLGAEAAQYPDAVRLWMRVMAASFFSGALVAIWDRRALWAVAMALATICGLVVVRMVLPDIPRGHSGAAIHLLIWPLALWAIWSPPAGGHMIFRVWRISVSAIAGLSLALDLRVVLSWLG